MNKNSKIAASGQRLSMVALGFGLVVACASAPVSEETGERSRIAAANMRDAIVVDCQLPGKLRRLGGTRTYLTPGRLIRTAAIDCRTRGGEYTIGDLASGTLSLQRWMTPAQNGDPEAQYYVARIYATGMDDVSIDYAQAAEWYEKAAQQGYAEAKQELGYLYERGWGVRQDSLKALNLQREASGLGERLDYAYKIENAQALAAGLAEQLAAANSALRDAQLALGDMQDELYAARENARRQEAQLVTLIADLEEARRAAPAAGNGEQIAQLERQLAAAKAELSDRQLRIVRLERERNTARAELSTQLAGGQATQLELRELIARTERAESRAETLEARLAEAQQRLIHADEEIRALQTAYREQSEELAAERERLLAARTRTATDAQAYIAAMQAEVAVREARIESLESELGNLERRLEDAQDTTLENYLTQELESLRARYDDAMVALRHERDMLGQTRAASEAQLNTLYRESKQRLDARESELVASRREIETLTAESERLRSRVGQLEAEQLVQANQSGLDTAQLEAQLAMSRQQVATLKSQLVDMQADKSALEAKLLKDRLALEEQMTADNTASAAEVALLRAEIEAAESTINLQALRIAALEKETEESSEKLAELRSGSGEPESPPLAQIEPAMTLLQMARSRQDPYLGRYHALLIANQDYVHMDDLTTPIRDVAAIQRLLATRYGFNVKVLTNATEDTIMTTLHDYTHTLTEDDNLLIYYAGRGSTPDGPPDRAYWLGVDADPNLRNTWLLADHISEKVKAMQAKRVLLVTDSCFSRRRVQSATMAVGRGLDPEGFRLKAQFRSRFVLTSGANVPVYDESGDRRHSLFARSFMEILRQNRNVLSGEMLSYEMITRVRQSAADPDNATPAYNFLQDAGHKAGDFFFVPVEEPVLVATRTPTPDSV